MVKTKTVETAMIATIATAATAIIVISLPLSRGRGVDVAEGVSGEAVGVSVWVDVSDNKIKVDYLGSKQSL